MERILQVTNLNKNFGNTKVLKNINLEVQKNEFVAIMGPSGSGKSTLLYNISGMDNPTSGEVLFDQLDIAKLNDKESSHIRLKKMGFIFQHSHLLQNLSIRDNIVLPGLKAKLQSNDAVSHTADQLMNKVGISDIAANDIKKVSGGQLQRAAICRALINQPRIIFGDEPTGALNTKSSKEVMDILNEINADGSTIILVTHDSRVAARADRIIYLIDGTIADEYHLGKYHPDNNSLREKQLNEWLEGHGL